MGQKPVVRATGNPLSLKRLATMGGGLSHSPTMRQMIQRYGYWLGDG